MEPGEYDVGNKYFAGQEAMVIFDNVFIPNKYIFMNGEFEFS
jgi:4-hydroxybutyryl-CoA dehydratase/vinylacetyl-CoA-Delta-isomerase